MSTKWQVAGVSLVSLVVGVAGGAYLGAALLYTHANPVDRLAFELRKSAGLIADRHGAPIGDAARLEKALWFVQSETAALGMMFDDISAPGARDVAIETLRRIDANPLVRADDKNPGAKVARECLIAEAAKAAPDYAMCAAKVREIGGYVAVK